MEKEVGFFPNEKQPITNVQDFIALLIRKVPKYTIDMLDKPQEGGGTTLRAF